MYKIRIRKSPHWRDYDTALLGISVGQPYHEGEKLQATLTWTVENYKNVTLVCADTLQRYSEMGLNGVSEADATAITRQRGDEWLNRNSKVLEEAGLSGKVIRWTDLIDNEEVQQVARQLQALNQPGHRFFEVLNLDINAFVERYKKRGVADEAQLARLAMFSGNYLIEELAVDIIAARKTGGSVVYPGPQHNVYAAVRRKEIPEVPLGLEKGYHTYISLDRVGAAAL